MKNIIFVGGLDSRDKKGFATPAPPGDLNLEQQTDLISKGYGSGANIASFRHNAATGLITQSITDNPGAVVILFSAGCSKSKAIADHLKSINQPLNLLHINEPYTCAPGGTSTANQINAAIALGVPKTNVYSGGYDCAGNNISGHTKLVGRTPGGSAAAHFNSLTPLGKLIASLKTEDPAPVATTTPASPAQSKSVIATGPGKDFINKFNEELEKLYTEATTSLGPWKKAREEAIKITKPRIGVWPVDPAVKTIGDLFAHVFFDPDGLKFNSPPFYQKRNEQGGVDTFPELQKQYNDWINDMNGAMPLPASPTGALVLDPTISAIFKSLAFPKKDGWTGNRRNSNLPIKLSDSVKFIERYKEIKKPGITNPDKYSAGQWWFDLFMENVIGEDGYLKSNENRSNNSKIEEVFKKSRFSAKFLNNNKKIEGDTNVYTISVSKFVKGETVPIGLSSSAYPYDRGNYTDYGGLQEYGFAKILYLEMNTISDSFKYERFDIRKEEFNGLTTQYRAGVNSLESLSKDPLFNFNRTGSEDTEGDIIKWTGTGTQSIETGVYWTYEGGTASIVGNFEHILLYNAFLEAGDNYKTITLPKYPPEPVKVEAAVVSTLVPTTESKLSGEFTFNVEKKNTFVVVGNQNFALKIGDLVIEGLTTSSVIDSPKTIDLGDGVILIDDGESDEDIYTETGYQGSDGVDDPVALNIVFEAPALKMMRDKEVENEKSTETGGASIKMPGGGSMLGKVNIDYKVKGSNWGRVKKGMNDADLLKAMVAYIEGGYYYPGQAYTKFSEKDRKLYGSSGETLWGVDRHAGQTENTSEGKLFWGEVDKLSGYGDTSGTSGYSRKTATKNWDISSYNTKSNGWSYGYSPKPGSAGYDVMYDSFVKYATGNLNKYLNSNFKTHPVKNLILSDSRLKFLWFRSTWNGSGWFSWYANGKEKKGIKGLMWAHDNVTKNPDELIIWDLNNRLKFGNELITHDVRKMSELLGIDPNGGLS